MKLTYTFAKDPRNGTAFEIIRTKRSADDQRELIVRLHEDSKSDKFQFLQEHDLLISAEDLQHQRQENILVVEFANQMPMGKGTVLHIGVRGLTTNIFGIDEFEDGETLYFIGRAERND